jgi:hypothetical protein
MTVRLKINKFLISLYIFMSIHLSHALCYSITSDAKYFVYMHFNSKIFMSSENNENRFFIEHHPNDHHRCSKLIKLFLSHFTDYNDYMQSSRSPPSIRHPPGAFHNHAASHMFAHQNGIFMMCFISIISSLICMHLNR